jgi:alpha-beta hydrolase superfamily lysophospholipase
MGHNIFSISSNHGKKINGNNWLISPKPEKAIIIVHGMSEYSLRYQNFAKILNEQGYDVYALDHLGHGLNASNTEDLGKWPRDGFNQCVDNVYCLVLELKKKYRDVYIFSHSMGSLMTQNFMETYPGAVDKIVLCGSSGPQGLYKIGKGIAKVHCFMKNKDKPSKFLTLCAFGSYNNKIKKPKTAYDWLSWNEDNVAKYIEDENCGFIQSRMFYLSFLENLPTLHTKKNLAKIDKNTKVLLIAGEDDPVGNYTKSLVKLNNIYHDLGINSSLITYPHMRHEILNEKNNDKVTSDIIEFYKNF